MESGDSVMDVDEPKVRRVIVNLCEPCIKGEGEECHTPGCILYLHAVDLPIAEELMELCPDFFLNPLHFRAESDPEAGGRRVAAGDQRWTLRFKLEDGRDLFVDFGRVGREALIRMLHEEAVDDAIEEAGNA